MVLTIQDAMSKAASALPDQCAVWSAEGTLTYSELEQKSTSLALWINQNVPGNSQHIALLMPKSIEAVIAIFGILKSGNTYAPLGENWTQSRLQKIFSSNTFSLCITHLTQEEYAAFEHKEFTQHLACHGDEWNEALSIPTELITAPLPTLPDQLAYILYTSGSTGVPKGVCVSHQAAAHFPLWAIQEYELTQSDRIASVSPLTFDLTTFDLFATLGSGATLYLVPENMKIFPARLSKFLVKHAITRIYAVPSTLILLSQRGKLADRDFSHLRSVIFAGEEFPVPQFQQLADRLPAHIQYSNLYGPTETNVCTYFHVPASFDQPHIPLGHALPGMHLFLRQNESPNSDSTNALEGELCVSGPSVMSGYLSQTDSNSDIWVQDTVDQNVQAYATGDLTSLSTDGLWHYHGRIDNMVKIWGYRVELGEIETCLLTHKSVEQAAVVKRTHTENVGDELIGYVVPTISSTSNNNSNKLENLALGEKHFIADILLHCKQHLPQYMVPKTIISLSNLPLNNSGKIDRSQLAKIAADND